VNGETIAYSSFDAPGKVSWAAPEGELRGILGFEDRPLVSVDFVNDSRSAIVDGPSTMIVDGTQVKIIAWYDNEWGYVIAWSSLPRRSPRVCRWPKGSPRRNRWASAALVLAAATLFVKLPRARAIPVTVQLSEADA